MKRSHELVMRYLQQALMAASQDERMAPVRRLIGAALAECQQVGKKRVHRETTLERLAFEAKKKSQQWWETLQENARKFKTFGDAYRDEAGNDPATEFRPDQ